ncbi:LacI family transcriptional regulator [Kribbella amoyensis]|uniref:LacI family transcriptional regulator n=1 Tax=Kribbella amoyensis TaxID=996641 RepID=A0A561B8T9_9ACTN|nr:LacI family DNA-binding transcriptional regulator [Kribbella amoyensis]TWD75178.1 LacI family transcriptional regulator [Kribbella amoyensis]
MSKTSRGGAAPSAGRATIHDVARIAAVSTATVSRVMSGGKPVSTEVTDRVRAAAREVGYRPNPAAQTLLRGRSQTIGVVAPDLGNPYFAEILKGVAAEAAEVGHHTLVAGTDEDPEREYRSALELARWVDGLLLCAPRMSTPRLKEVAAASRSLVLINRVLRHPSIGAVVVDYSEGVKVLCEHLAGFGHERIVYLEGPPNAWSDRQRQRGFRTAEALGQTVIPIPCGSAMQDGYATADEALKHQPTAVIAFNDHVALGVFTRLRELGIDVPGELSLIGIDDAPMSAHTDPGLTTFAVSTVDLGRLAWQKFTSDPGAGVVHLSGSLVVRGSTGPAPRKRRRATKR